MSTLLHQAVQLAQAGQKAEAHQLIQQFLQTEPNNETAWLWLASVAADQVEYQRALNEVLRINPGNQRARQLLTEFEQQQYGGASPYAPPQQPVSPPPSPSPFAPPQQVSPPSPYGAPQQSGSPLPLQGSPYSQQQVSPPSGVSYTPPIEVKVKAEKRRGCLGCGLPGCGCLGCGGCGQGCLLALLILVIVPAVLCAGLSVSPLSLGPLDIPASYLPGEMGRKEISITTDAYDISLKTPRSWYLVQTNDQMWNFWSDALENTIPYEDTTQTWADLETYPGVEALIVDVNFVTLTESGDITTLELLPGVTSENFGCDAIHAKFAGVTNSYQQVFEYGGGLCAYRATDNPEAGPAQSIFKNVDPPTQMRTIVFYTPINNDTGLKWQMTIPEKSYTAADTQDDIDALIRSVKTTPK